MPRLTELVCGRAGPETKPSAIRVHAFNHCMTLSLPSEAKVAPVTHKDVEDMQVLLLVAGIALIYLDPMSVL